MTPCLVRLPKPLMHDVVIALRSDSLPHTHMWGSQRLVPRRKPTATLTASLSNFSPHEAIGMDKSQSPACGAVTALQLAWSDALGNESAISSMTRSRSGLSHMRCFALCGNSGGSAFVAAIRWVLRFSRWL